MNSATRIKLSVMMFLEYAIWSVWALMLVPYLAELNMSEFSIGLIMACGGLGSIVGPFIVGQLADRHFATEKVLAVSHLIGGLLLIAASYGTTFWPIFLLMLVYCTLYFPTVGLTNSLTFRALGEEHASLFAPIRLWGTIGWLLATFLVGRYLNLSSETAPFLKPFFDQVGEPKKLEVLRIPGLISLVFGLYCFGLPHTPAAGPAPATAAPKKSAFIETLELMKDRSFAVLLLVSGFFGFALYYYFQCEGRFLPHVGSNPNNVGTQMTIGQIGEMISMALVPLVVARIGMKWTMTLGGLAYVAMFALNMLGQPWALMVGANILHGFCFGFLFVVASMYVDKAASADIKASVQSLFVFVVYGLFNVVGNVGAGYIRDLLLPNWAAIWAIPLVVTVVFLLVFVVLFREEKIAQPEQRVEPAAV
jgi:nucleoside transporter